MKPIVRILTLLMALLLICCAFVACNGNGEDEKQTDDTTETESSGETEAPELSLAFPQENNNNTPINILMSTSLSYEIALESSADRVEGAMFERNCDVEEYLGVVINIIPQDGGWGNRNNFNTLVQNSALSTPEYDLVQNSVSTSFIQNAKMGYFMDVNTVNTLDFSTPWWLAGMNENYAINGKLYGVIGDMSLSLYKQMTVIYFNDFIIEQYSLDNPYDLVRADEWTMEKMMTMAIGVKENVDGEYDITKNMMGFVAAATANRQWLTALDLPLTSRDNETGALSVASAPGEKLIAVFDYMYDKFENNACLHVEDNADYKNIFTAGNALFSLGYFWDVESFRDMEQDYGLVPMCKWNAEQEDYISPISTSVGMWHIMTNTSKAALVGKTMEALSFYGYRDVTPEYYEVALGLTYARDENVLEMLSLMREKATLSLDMAYGSAFSPAITNILQMSEGFRNPPSGKENSRHGSNISTFWATNQSAWNTNVRELFEKLS